MQQGVPHTSRSICAQVSTCSTSRAPRRLCWGRLWACRREMFSLATQAWPPCEVTSAQAAVSLACYRQQLLEERASCAPCCSCSISGRAAAMAGCSKLMSSGISAAAQASVELSKVLQLLNDVKRAYVLCSAAALSQGDSLVSAAPQAEQCPPCPLRALGAQWRTGLPGTSHSACRARQPGQSAGRLLSDVYGRDFELTKPHTSL